MIGQRCSLSLPIVFYIFNILQQCSLLPCLTIDNRIAVTANDCYTRISIGSKLPDVNIVSRIVVASLTECEDQCSKNGNTCNAFTFGVDPNGNGTCATSTRIPMLQDLETHTDYDVYVKKRQASPWCNVDRLYQDFTTLGNGHHLMKIERPNKEGLVTNIYGNSYSKGKDDYAASYGLVGIYDLFINRDGRFPSGDDNRRVLDILANRNRVPASSSPFGELRDFMYIYLNMEMNRRTVPKENSVWRIVGERMNSSFEKEAAGCQSFIERMNNHSSDSYRSD